MAKDANIILLKSMHEVVLMMNDESAYDWWIMTVPDEPTEDDFDYIARNDELMDDACMSFRSIIRTYGEYGWFTGHVENEPLVAYGADED